MLGMLLFWMYIISVLLVILIIKFSDLKEDVKHRPQAVFALIFLPMVNTLIVVIGIGSLIGDLVNRFIITKVSTKFINWLCK